MVGKLGSHFLTRIPQAALPPISQKARNGDVADGGGLDLQKNDSYPSCGIRQTLFGEKKVDVSQQQNSRNGHRQLKLQGRVQVFE